MGKCKTSLLRITVNFVIICALWGTTSCGSKTNLGGLYTRESSSYTPVETGTFRVTSDDLVNRRNHQGGKTTFLWGLFTYTDY